MSGRPSKRARTTVTSNQTLEFFFARKNEVVSPDNSDEAIAQRLQAQFDAEWKEQSQEPKSVVPDPSHELNGIPDSEVLSTEPEQPARPALDALVESDAGPRSIEEIDFTVDGSGFDPHGYSIARPAEYAILTQLFTQVDATRSRIKIVSAFTNYFRLIMALDKAALLPSIWLSTNAIGPSYKGAELGIGGQVISKALRSVSGITQDKLKRLHDAHGDIGDVAFEAKVSVRTLVAPARLKIKEVHDTLLQIAAAKGNKSLQVKQQLVEKLMIRARGEEVRYLTRTFVQHLRIGAVRSTILTALARACVYHAGVTTEELTRAEELVRQCYVRHPDYNDLVPALLDGGLENLQSTCGMALHVPIMPMLGSITKDLPEMLVKIGNEDVEFACEFKYDGQRAQVHLDESGKISIFSRHLEAMTDKYPDLVDVLRAQKHADTQSFILEGEVVAIDKARRLLPFQQLAQRGRTDVQRTDISVTVCLFAFDLMYLNGSSLLGCSFRRRRELLRSAFSESPNFAFAESVDATTRDTDAISAAFASALANKCEGLMVKLLDPGHDRRLSTYTPDLRSEAWLKVKKDYDSGADSLDLVPIGGWHGMGRKAKFWSPVLLAVRDAETGEFQAVCKCISGFTDVQYKETRERYDEGSVNVSKTKPHDFNTPLTPEYFWVPQVWEIKFADITLSPVYPAAQGLVSERGLSIRFPRFIRKREDKSVEEASTPEFLADLYERQVRSSISNQK